MCKILVRYETVLFLSTSSKKWANPGLFLFILKTHFTEQIEGFTGIRTWITGVVGEYADPFAITNAQSN